VITATWITMGGLGVVLGGPALLLAMPVMLATALFAPAPYPTAQFAPVVGFIATEVAR